LERQTASDLVNSLLLIFCHVVCVFYTRRKGSSDLKERQTAKEEKDDTTKKTTEPKNKQKNTTEKEDFVGGRQLKAKEKKTFLLWE